MYHTKSLLDRIEELEELLELSERKADILTNLLKEANVEFEQVLEKVSVSEANFRAIFENAPEAIFIVDRDTRRILDCNAFATQWLGYLPEELQALRMDDLMVPAAKGIPNNVLGGWYGGGGIRESRFKRKNGAVVDAEVAGTILECLGKRCMVAMARDVTERKQLEELSRYKEIFESVTDPMFINDYRGRLLEVNDVVCDHFGYSREELLQMAVKHLAKPGQVHILYETRRQIENGMTIKFEMEVVTKTGKCIPFEFHARPITYHGQPAVLSVARDLSLRKKLEQTLVETARLTAMGEMASGVAHNFNNLLQMIMGATEASLAKLEAGKIRDCRKAIQTIQAASQRGSEIVRRIKDFTHTQYNGMDEADSFDLGEIIQEAVDLTKLLWKDLADSRKYELHLAIQEGCLVKGKPSEIYEVLVNLVKNAVEAMPKRGSLSISTEIVDGRIHLKVSDTGIGIPAENLERIFQPFFTTKGVKSSGLGLSSSYGIIKRHQGEIQAESTVGQGTTFTVKLPLAEKPAASKVAAPVSAESPRIRFLMIEDEINIIKAMELYFEETEVEMVASRTATEGIETYRRNSFDVILCDLGLDDLTGWEVGKHIKDYCLGKGVSKTPFLLYTGWDKQFDEEQLAESGVDRVVIKPVSCEELLYILREIVCPHEAAERTILPSE